jgi:hypothetical protein
MWLHSSALLTHPGKYPLDAAKTIPRKHILLTPDALQLEQQPQHRNNLIHLLPHIFQEVR